MLSKELIVGYATFIIILIVADILIVVFNDYLSLNKTIVKISIFMDMFSVFNLIAMHLFVGRHIGYTEEYWIVVMFTIFKFIAIFV